MSRRAGWVSASLAIGAVMGVTLTFVIQQQRRVAPVAAVTSYALAQVARGAVVEQRTFEATVVAEWATTLTVPPTSAPGRLVVTDLPRRNANLRAGQVIASINGRPIILLTGRLASYRDLTLGDTGPDVAQVQSALRQVGCPVYDQRGVLGPSTARCVRQLYRTAGVDPPPAPAPAPAPLSTASDTEGSSEGDAVSAVLLPWAEVLFVPHQRVKVAIASSRRGAVVQPGAKLVTLTSGGLSAQVTPATEDDRAVLRPGTRVEVATALLEPFAKGLVADASSSGRVRVRLTVRADAPAVAPGDDVQVSVLRKGSPPDGLTVPVQALTTTAAGTPAVRTVTGEPAVLKLVPVRVSLIANGQAAITPLGGADLREGQNVAVPR